MRKRPERRPVRTSRRRQPVFTAPTCVRAGVARNPSWPSLRWPLILEQLLKLRVAAQIVEVRIEPESCGRDRIERRAVWHAEKIVQSGDRLVLVAKAREQACAQLEGVVLSPQVAYVVRILVPVPQHRLMKVLRPR